MYNSAVTLKTDKYVLISHNIKYSEYYFLERKKKDNIYPQNAQYTNI